ncbi:MAG: hybrid sensor histidine kinase/response regulator [Burkholderiaceae bacterium]|jgi:signal transduction histidine kinase/CheY-like chemotaxis protein|nr:hybrid sensor histidine kinase/response regulator [Burkholderiaceae bacterium]
MAGSLDRFANASEQRAQRHEQILAGVIASVHQQVPRSVLGSMVGAAAILAVYWQEQDRGLLLGWFVAMLLESLLRLRMSRSFRVARVDADNVHTWSARWVVQAAVAGVLWGAAGGLFFLPADPTKQLVLVTVLLGVAFGSLTLYAAYRPALVAFLPVALLPLIVRMLAEQEPAFVTAAVVLAAMLAYTMFFGRSFGATMFEAVRHNFENEVLVGQLLREKRVADEARRAAEEATRSKTKFFAAASHDLRQPLQAIGIYCSLLKKRATGPLEPLAKSLGSAVDSLSKLVEELLEISRLDAGAIQPRLQQVLLDEMLGQIAQEFTPLAHGKGLRLRVRRPRLAVESDPVLLARVLRNLLGNAIRYTASGGVLLAARPRGGLVSIEVWDTGPGIKQGELSRVFDEFYRGESARGEPAGGFGLGLSIVRRICNVLGHPLIVSTRPGSGTVFRVETPLSALPHRGPRPPATLNESSLRQLTGHTLVLIEDNEEIRASLDHLLRSWGAEVIAAAGYTEQLQAQLRPQRRVDLILADQNLHDETTGVEVALKIRESVGGPVPVLMLTAVTAGEVIGEFQRAVKRVLQSRPTLAGVVARSRVEEPVVLQKPINAILLNHRIARSLGLMEAPRQEPTDVAPAEASATAERR